MDWGQRTARLMVVFVLFAVGCSPVAASTADEDEADARLSGRAAESRTVSRLTNLDGAILGLSGVAGAVDGLNLVAGSPVVPDGATIVAQATGTAITARQGPDSGSSAIETFNNPTTYGGPLVFQAVAPDLDEDGWIEVLLPVRPNGTTGWIRTAEIDQTVNPYRIEVDPSLHSLRIQRFDEEVLSTTVAIGTGATPTPIGEFYLVELVRPSDPNGLYGSFAYGLSGYSETLDNYNGGQGVIGIHGTNEPDLLGEDVSHGCIRVANPTIEQMVDFLPLGTPVHIFRSQPTEPGPANAS